MIIERMNRLVAMMCLGLMLSVLGASSHAAEPRFKNILMSNTVDGIVDMDEFKPDTPKIYLKAGFVNIQKGTQLKAVWIAEKVKGVQRDYEIDAYEVTVGPPKNLFSTSLSRPKAGWPTGDYRVELYIDDELMETVEFKIRDN
jgi:hypothetical protein